MGQVGERRVVLFPSTAVAAGTVASTNTLCVAGYTAAILALNVSAITTGTTLDVYIQQELPVASATDKRGDVPSGTFVWDDFLHFTQVTTSTGSWVAHVVGGSNAAGPLKDATLAAATVVSGPIGSNWRVKYVAVGTSYTFGVTAVLLP
jgi:hypothetical protein